MEGGLLLGEEGAAAGEGGYFVVEAGQAVVHDLSGAVAVLDALGHHAREDGADRAGVETGVEEFADAVDAGDGLIVVGAITVGIALRDKESLLFVVAEQARGDAGGLGQFSDQHCDLRHSALTFTSMSIPNVAAMTNISLSTTVAGSGPAIVLAHGAGGGIAANFGGLIPLLTDRHTVIGSDYPADDTHLDLDELADALVAAAVAAGAAEFTIVGYSLGTAVAVRAAVRHPERVRGLVLTAGFARADNRTRLTAELWRRLLAADDREGFARIVLLSGFDKDFVNAIPPEQLPDLLAMTAANIPGGTAAQAALVIAADVTADLARIAVPTLVIGLTGDLLVDPANARAQAAGIPGAEYLELSGGHVVMLEQPDPWHAAVLEFLERRPAVTAG